MAETLSIVLQNFGKVNVGLIRAITLIISSLILSSLAYISDLLRQIGLKKDFRFIPIHEDMFKLTLIWDNFYARNAYRRMRDAFNRPVTGVPGAYIELMDRKSDDFNWTLQNTGSTTNCLNLASYNYLGFAEKFGPCAEAAIESLYQYGAGTNSSRRDLGTLDCVRELEVLVAKFVGKPDAIVFGMGFSTNSTNIPALVGKGCLILSDELNHSSLVMGTKLSGATAKVFKHNDIKTLEYLLREAIIKGQPKTHKPWKKIMIIVEGIYSMEGSIPNLREIVRLKKKYKAYLYLDEAHSIGALGCTGRGVTEYFGIDPTDVDIMMGTFTKSFGGCGGYIAADKDIVNHVRKKSHAAIYGGSMTAPVALQIMTSMKIIMGEDNTNEGQKRIAQLCDNSRYFRKRLNEMGFTLYGNKEAPVVPVVLYQPGIMVEFSRALYQRGIAVVIVGYPATPLYGMRARICLSASHTREMLDFALNEIKDLGEQLGITKKAWIF